MSFKTRYPDFAAVEDYVRQAQAQRAVYLADLFARGIMAVTRYVQRLAGIETVPARRARKGPLVVKATVTKVALRA